MGGIVAVGVAGALLTATFSAAKEIRKVRQEGKDSTEAVVSVAKESLGAGLATAAGAMVGRTFFRSSALGVAAMLAARVGVMYAYEGLTAPKTVEEVPAPAKSVKK